MDYPIRLFIVEDHPLVRIGLKMTLSQSDGRFEVVGEAGSKAEFFKKLPDVKADVVILDIILPDGTGVEIAKTLKASRPQLKILVLSAETDEETIVKLVDIGIDGFVVKNISTEDLYTAIEYVANGAEYYGREISKIIRDLSVAKNTPHEMFTEREMEILSLCAQGCPAKEIAVKLNISKDTVNTHKYNIFKKLGINNSVELVRYAIRHGIISL
mgnify:CR=1 FL=1